jgi:alpha-galactosidase
MKVTIIGAGSAVFWMSMMRDLCLMESAPGATISLVDINRERLDAVYDLGTRYAREVGVDVKFEKGDDRATALKGSDFVLNTALVGGHDYTEKVRKISEKHGYYRGIDHRQVRFIGGYEQYKLALEIASDIEELCPDAWLLEIANPVFDITTLISRERKIKVAGFCDGFRSGYLQLLLALGVSPGEVDFQVAGVNHCIWLTKFFYQDGGGDGYPLIDKWVKTEAETFWKNHELGLWEETLSPASVDAYLRFGLYPIGDTGREFIWKYYYDLESLKRWFGPIGGTDSEIGNPLRLQDFQRNVDKLFRLSNNPNASLTAEIPPEKGLDQFSDFIDAIHLGREKRLVINVPNKGSISQLPDDIAVEVPVNLRDGKLYPEKIVPFPKKLLNFVLLPRVLRMEWGLEAYLSGDRETLVEILLRDPRTVSETQAREALEEILALPEHKSLAAHYT